MKSYQLITCLTLVLGSLLLADHHGGSDHDLAKQLDDLIAGISVTDEAARYEPRMAVQDLTSQASAPGSTTRDAWVTLLLDRFGKDATHQAAKAWILRQLENIGGAEAVPVLVETLGSSFHHLRELARRALEKNSSEEAGAALRSLAGKELDAKTKRALVHSLGERRDAKAVEMLSAWLGGKDKALNDEVIRALGSIASPEAIKALTAAYGESNGKAKSSLATALFKAARHSQDDLVLRGLYQYDQPADIRATALRGLAGLGVADLEDIIIMSFQSEDAVVRRAAITSCRHTKPQSIVSNVLAYKLASLVPEEQSIALAVLSDMADTTVTPLIADVVINKDIGEPVKLEAIDALGTIGGADASDRLLAIAGRLEGDLRHGAKQSLASMPGEGVDASLLAATASGDITHRAEAILALGVRGVLQAIPVLFNYVDQGPKHLRRASLDALAQLAGPKDIATLTDYIGTDEQVIKALVAVCRRNAKKSGAAKAILADFPSQSVEIKQALLPCLSILGGMDGLKTVRSLVGNEELRLAAMKALTSWSGGEAAPVLISLAGGKNVSEGERTLIFRGLVRLLESRSSELEPAQQLSLALAGLNAAKDPSSKNVMLAVIGNLGTKEAGERLLTMLEDDELVEGSAQAALNVARSLGLRDRETADKILTTVAESEAPKDIIDRANEMLERGDRRRRR